METCDNQENAETYAGRLYDVNRLRDRWKGDLTSYELVIEKKLPFLMDLVETLS